MFRLAWRGVRNNAGRYIATLVAIMTGVAFFTATGFVSDRVIDALEGDVNRQYGGVDAAIVADTGADAADATFADQLRIPGDVVEQIKALPGVAAVGGDLTGSVAFLGDNGKTFGDGATGRLWIDDAALNPVDVVEGEAPDAAGEIAVDKGLSDDENLEVGDKVTVLTLAGQEPATVVGITEFGSKKSIDPNGTVYLPEATAFTWLSSGIVEYHELYLRTDGSQDDLVKTVQSLVPKGFKIQTGAQFLSDKRDEIGAFGRTLKIALQAFAGLALFVGGFVIYNTFSVIVAQRLRELAVLAAIGATPKQIKRSLRFEGLVIGLIGSALGVAAGFGLTFVLIMVLKSLGVELPGSGIRVSPQVVSQGMFSGTLITFMSVMIPARRAARTEPIEALRQAAVESTKPKKRRTVIALAFIGLGVLGMLGGGNAAAIGGGAFILVIGVIMAGPIIALVGARLSRPILHRFGLEGRLAADNTARNPKRTATTANALLIGVFLVTFVTVAGTSLKDFVVGEVQKLSSADYIINSVGGTIDEQLVADISAVDGVKSITPFRHESVTVNEKASALATGDFAALQAVANLEVKEGSLDDLTDGTIAIIDDGVTKAAIGDKVTVADAKGDTIELTVTVLLKGSIDAFTTGNLVTSGTFDSLVGDTAPTMAFIDVETGAQTDTEDAIQEIADLRPDVTLTKGNELGRIIGSIFDFMINAVNGLLLMSVVVALIGIVNTLSLSILERRKELGLLRVIGMVDKRVQRMVRLESVLVSGLGTVTGLLLGGFIGVATVLSINRLSEAGVSISMPWTMLGIVLFLGILLGFLASLIPAKRSTRLEVLEAIQAT